MQNKLKNMTFLCAHQKMASPCSPNSDNSLIEICNSCRNNCILWDCKSSLITRNSQTFHYANATLFRIKPKKNNTYKKVVDHAGTYRCSAQKWAQVVMWICTHTQLHKCSMPCCLHHLCSGHYHMIMKLRTPNNSQQSGSFKVMK